MILLILIKEYQDIENMCGEFWSMSEVKHSQFNIPNDDPEAFG